MRYNQKTFDLKLKIKVLSPRPKGYRISTTHFTINCYTENTSTGYKEVAEVGRDKFTQHYINRSWQRFDYEACIIEAIYYLLDLYNINIKTSISSFIDKNLKEIY